MIRYVDTFFRYWLIAIVPVVALPLVAYTTLVRHAPTTVVASVNLWVQQNAGSTTSYNQWNTPAQNESAILDQLLQTSGFDRAVAAGSPIYRSMLAKMPAYQRDNAVVSDLVKNLQISSQANWSILINVSYTSKNWQLAQQVILSFLNAARDRIEQMNQQQATQNQQYYEIQLQNAVQSQKRSAKALSDYLAKYGINPNEVSSRLDYDPTLATLYKQNQSDQQNVIDVQTQLAKLQGQTASSSSRAQSPFEALDPPTITAVSSKKTQIMNLAIALILGLLLGGGFIVFKTAMDRSLRYATEVPRLLDLPILAVIPYDHSLARRRIGETPSGDKVISDRRLIGLRRTG